MKTQRNKGLKHRKTRDRITRKQGIKTQEQGIKTQEYKELTHKETRD